MCPKRKPILHEGMLFSECDLPASSGDCSFSVDESLVRDGEMLDDCSVDEIVSASRDSFPNVEELVSRLTSKTHVVDETSVHIHYTV